MASHLPIVRDPTTQLLAELPAGDTISGVGVFPFFLSNAAAANIALVIGNALPFYINSGAASNISLV